MDIKELLLEGCRISMPYKANKKDWVGETKIHIFSGGCGCLPKIIVEGDYCNGYRKEFEVDQLDEAIEYFKMNTFNVKNLWYKMPEAVLTLTKTDPNLELEDPDDYKAVDQIKQKLIIKSTYGKV
jgi:hypothetical protein